MRIGVITGSGSYDWPHLEGAAERTVVTDHGAVTVTEGRLEDKEIVQLSRHGAGHHRLSSQVDHTANLAALLARRTDALVSFTVCGSIDPGLRPGSLVGFVTDYANGVAAEPEPVHALLDPMAASKKVFATPAGHALPAPDRVNGAGFVCRFDA